jgi:hypothetical protein
MSIVVAPSRAARDTHAEGNSTTFTARFVIFEACMHELKKRLRPLGSYGDTHFGFHHHHHFRQFFFVGGAPYDYSDDYSYDDCLRRVWTGYGVRWINVCGDYGY